METVHLFLMSIVAGVAVGKFDAICQTQPVKAQEGEDVTLPCRLRPAADVSTYTVDWKRVDLNKVEVVHSYRHRKDESGLQMEQYRNRTKLNHEELKRGILDLRISSVRLSDSGVYKCNVPKNKTSCTNTVTVVKKEKVRTNKEEFSTTQPPLGEVTKPNNSGAEQMNVVGVVCGVIFTAVITTVIIAVTIKRLRGRKEQEPQVAANGSTLEMLNNQEAEGGETLQNPVENCSVLISDR
ncbi:butyrophilin-like protein 1 [Anabas testudineus]|uniref:Ig-like domain-containing protein n=1 Tax=Anabas testudineus TaxID=64144 RepID=A0AAQ6ICS5_ANATE|nr:butyrophilin-like protein 1 [Anabas testudineus]